MNEQWHTIDFLIVRPCLQKEVCVRSELVCSIRVETIQNNFVHLVKACGLQRASQACGLQRAKLSDQKRFWLIHSNTVKCKGIRNWYTFSRQRANFFARVSEVRYINQQRMKAAIPIHKVYKGWESLGKSSNNMWEVFTKRTFCHSKLRIDCKFWLRLWQHFT